MSEADLFRALADIADLEIKRKFGGMPPPARARVAIWRRVGSPLRKEIVIARLLLVCALVLALIACRKTEAPAPATATAPETAQASGGPVPPRMCEASKTKCAPLSQCAQWPITSAAATIPAKSCTFEDGQNFVDIYSWNAFLALNWPVTVANCTANTSKNIVNVKSGDGTFVVWQTYMPGERVFVNPGTKRPAAWCTGNGLAEGAQRIFSNEAKAVPEAKRLGDAFVGISEPGGNVLQAKGGVLTDQSGRWVRYERLMNRVEYDYIVPHRWNALQLQDMKARKQEIVLPVGVIEIKAAWKVLTQDEINKARYFTTMGIVCNTPDGERTPCDAKPVTMGLVGLHIVHQTSPGGNLFWSTFEQVDNETVFRNPKIVGAPVNTDFAKEPYTELDASCKPLNQPTEVSRVHPIPASPELNKYYRDLLGGSVFANYQLISTQWTTGAGPSQYGIPLHVANITLETYAQNNVKIIGGNPLNKATGCFSCHFDSVTVVPDQKGGHSFFWLEAKYPTKGP